jgi:predicted nuclease of predicted toxin-antitoxin system
MTIAFYMDEHVHRAITNGLRLRNVDVLTVQEDDQTGVSDEMVLARSITLNRVVFTQDDDFLLIANRLQQQGVYFTGVIYGHQQKVTVGDCVRDLEMIAKAAAPEDLASLVQYLPL